MKTVVVFGGSFRGACCYHPWLSAADGTILETPGEPAESTLKGLQIPENTMDPAQTAFHHAIVSGAVFTNEFGVPPEPDFVEPPVGIIYIATRRVGENIWARIVENVLPNLQQWRRFGKTAARSILSAAR